MNYQNVIALKCIVAVALEVETNQRRQQLNFDYLRECHSAQDH